MKLLGNRIYLEMPKKEESKLIVDENTKEALLKEMLKKMSRLKKLIFGETPYVKVEDKNRFYYMLQQMQANRWKITMIVLFLFFFIIAGINSAIFFGVSIEESWKEMLLILFGAFVGNLNKVVDYWFNSEDRDKMLIQKVDEEDGVSLSSTLDN